MSNFDPPTASRLARNPIGAVGIHCDFCNHRQGLEEGWTFPADDFEMRPRPPGAPERWSRGSWAACDACKAAYDSGGMAALTRRSVESNLQTGIAQWEAENAATNNGPVTVPTAVREKLREHLVAELTRLHGDLAEHLTGPPLLTRELIRTCPHERIGWADNMDTELASGWYCGLCGSAVPEPLMLIDSHRRLNINV